MESNPSKNTMERKTIELMAISKKDISISIVNRERKILDFLNSENIRGIPN